MTKHSFNLKFSEPQYPECKGDIRVARLFGFVVGFISALVIMYIALV